MDIDKLLEFYVKHRWKIWSVVGAYLVLRVLGGL